LALVALVALRPQPPAITVQIVFLGQSHQLAAALQKLIPFQTQAAQVLGVLRLPT
jgi:hypothetical protein